MGKPSARDYIIPRPKARRCTSCSGMIAFPMVHAGEEIGQSQREHRLALGAVILSALIFSTSTVVIKVVLTYTGPITAAGLRYLIAFAFLFLWLRVRRETSPPPTRSHWVRFVLIGLCMTIASGSLFLALKTLSPTTASLAFCLTPIPTLLFGALWLKEHPSLPQLLGLALAIGGIGLFFSPRWEGGQALAIGLLILFILGDTTGVVIAREVARHRRIGSITLTAYPIGISGVLLFILGVGVEGMPHMPLSAWGIIIGLAIVNTGTAYLLFYHSLRHLTAIKAYVVTNLSPFGTALIAWAAFGERLLPLQIVAMLLAVAGVSLVQYRKRS